MRNQDFMDAINVASYLIGVANYNENLTQNDKAEIMNKLDTQTKDILIKIEEYLEAQNVMLEEILRRLDNGQGKQQSKRKSHKSQNLCLISWFT